MSGRRIGILGGTFDPVHVGHLIVAAEARAALELDELVFMPARTPPHKPLHVPAPVEDRAAMIAAAIDGEPRTRMGRIDLDRPGPHYTVDMLAIARAEWRLDAGDRLWFVMGGDSLADLAEWRDPWRIVEMARLAVVERPGYRADDSDLEAVVPGLHRRVDRVGAPLVGISGSDIRARRAAGANIRWHVPPEVERYILEHRLYGPGGSS